MLNKFYKSHFFFLVHYSEVSFSRFRIFFSIPQFFLKCVEPDLIGYDKDGDMILYSPIGTFNIFGKLILKISFHSINLLSLSAKCI